MKHNKPAASSCPPLSAKLNRACAFTLIELLVVVLIIGILAAIAVPMYTKTVTKSAAMEAVINTRLLAESMNRYYLEHNAYITSYDDLDISPAFCTPTSKTYCNSKDFTYIITMSTSSKGLKQIAAAAYGRSKRMTNLSFAYGIAPNNYLRCMAKEGDKQSQGICKSFGWTKFEEGKEAGGYDYYHMFFKENIL